MPPTSKPVASPVSQQAGEPILAKPSKEDVVQAIYEEATAKDVECAVVLAGQVYEMLDQAVKAAREYSYPNAYHLTNEDLATLHDVLEVVMVGHDESPAPNTAHALIHAHFLRDGECALVHTIDETRGAVYCAVELRLHRS